MRAVGSWLMMLISVWRETAVCPFADTGGNIMERAGKGDRRFAGLKLITTVYKPQLAEGKLSV